MKARYIVLLKNPTAVQQDKLTNYFRREGVGFWHWFREAWLVTDLNRRWTAPQLRDKINELAPGVHHLVIQADESRGNWAAFGKPVTFQWLHDDWDSEGYGLLSQK